jgi:hypothetical protein
MPYRDKDKDKAYHKAYCQEHKDKITAQKKVWWQENKDKIKTRMKVYRQENKDKIKAHARAFYQENKDKINAQQKTYYQENKDKANERWKNLYKNNGNFRIGMILRSRERDALNGQGVKKTKSALKLLGCSKEEAWQHLEKQFKPGMTRENHGLKGWHFDHIRPCCSFDLKKLSEQKKCFHYTNLQPLWAEENLSKNGKYEEVK